MLSPTQFPNKKITRPNDGDAYLEVHGGQQLLALTELLFQAALLGSVELGARQLIAQLLDYRIDARYRLEQILELDFDFDDALGFEDATAQIGVGVHLHARFIDGRVDNDPGAAAQLGERRDVDHYGSRVVAQTIDDVDAKFIDLVVHVLYAA